MNAGYVRLSRDDDKRNYVSIENQKLIINQYAADHGVVIDRWYEDDGISGYIFDRPGFQQMMADLDKDIDTVYVKKTFHALADIMQGCCCFWMNFRNVESIWW